MFQKEISAVFSTCSIENALNRGGVGEAQRQSGQHFRWAAPTKVRYLQTIDGTQTSLKVSKMVSRYSHGGRRSRTALICDRLETHLEESKHYKRQSPWSRAWTKGFSKVSCLFSRSLSLIFVSANQCGSGDADFPICQELSKMIGIAMQRLWAGCSFFSSLGSDRQLREFFSLSVGMWWCDWLIDTLKFVSACVWW